MAHSITRLGRLERWPAVLGADAIYAAGALMLAAEAAVHLQQFAAEFNAVRWIGPLFLANAAACLVAAAGLARKRTRTPAALAGIVVSALALGGLVLSYGPGLLGWQEGGWPTAVALALCSELAAVLALSAGLALTVVGLRASQGTTL